MALGYFLKWLRDNLSISLAMVLMTTVVVGVYQATEIDAQQYRTLSATFVNGSDRYRARLADVREHGAVSKWLFRDLLHDFWTDSNSLGMPEPGASDLEGEREAFREVVASKASAVRQK